MRYRTIVQSFIFWSLIFFFLCKRGSKCRTDRNVVKKRNLIFYNVRDNSIGRSGRSRKKK